MASETLSKTSNEKIFVEKQQVISKDEIMSNLVALDRAITAKNSPEELIRLMRTMVPTYFDPDEINQKVIEAVDEYALDQVDAAAYPRVEAPA